MLHTAINSIALMKPWTPDEEAERLARRFAGVNQAAFAREHGLPGGASMVTQHIKGHRPISMDAAVVYASGFGVPLEEISPRLAELAKKAANVSSPGVKLVAAAASPWPFKRVTREQIESLSPEDLATAEGVLLGIIAIGRPGKRATS